MTKKLVSCILVVCMLLSMLPTMAWAEEASPTDIEQTPAPVAENPEEATPAPVAEEPVATGTDVTLNIANGSILITDTGYAQGIHKYTAGSGFSIVDGDENPVTETSYTGEITIIGENVATSEASRYVIMVEGAGQTITLNNVTSNNNNADSGSRVPAFLLLSGNATLKLKGINELVGTPQGPAVQINKDATLTITGPGTLNAITKNNASAIGAPRYNQFAPNPANGKVDNVYRNGGNLIIESGTINTTGSTGAGAGIGASHGTQFGNITINGGSVTVNSEFNGICTSTNTDGGGDIAIKGGDVNVTINKANNNANGKYAAIGGGKDGKTCSGDVTISGGKITIELKKEGAYAINTGGDFLMTGGTLAEIKGTPIAYIGNSSVSITGGNINSYYAEDIDGYTLSNLYFVNTNGTAVANSEVTVGTWKAYTNSDGIITTYVANNGSIAGGTKLPDGWLIGGTCVCDTAALTFEDTVDKVDVYSANAVVDVEVRGECNMPIHKSVPITVKIDSVTLEGSSTPVDDAAVYATYADGKLTLKPAGNAANYTVKLSATRGGASEVPVTYEIKALASNTGRVLDIANGAIAVVGVSGTDDVKYTQGGNTFTVDKDIPVTITGSYSYSTDNGNAIKIENCGPTIVLKDVTIATTGDSNSTNGGRKTGSIILISGTADNEVKLILSGTNTINRPNVGQSASTSKRNCGIEVRNATLTIECETHKGSNCNDKNCSDKLMLNVGSPFGAGIGTKSFGYSAGGNSVDGFTLNVEGGQISVLTTDGYRYGAAIGRGYVEGTNNTMGPIAITIKDGYVKTSDPDSGVGIGANSGTENVSVTVEGGVVESISTINGRGVDSGCAIKANSVTITNDAEIVVQGNVNAGSIALNDTANLEIQQKPGWTSSSKSDNPGGSINGTVTVNGSSSLTTAGGINGDLETSGNATVEINGTAASGTGSAPSDEVGGVSGTVTVGAGSSVAVTKEIKDTVTVEGGASINGTELPEDMGTTTIPAGMVNEVKKDDETGAVSLPAGTSVKNEDGAYTVLLDKGSVDSEGNLDSETPTATVETLDGKPAVGNADGTFTIPAGSTVNGAEIPAAAGTVTVPTENLDEVKVDDAGNAALPAGTVIENADGTTTTYPDGASVAEEGTVDTEGTKVTENTNGSVTITDKDGNETTITPAVGEKVTVNSDGTVTLPKDSPVTITKGEETTTVTPAGESATVSPDGTVELPAGSEVQSGEGEPTVLPEGTGAVTLPTDKLDEVTSGDDGVVQLPAGTVVETEEGKTTLPDGGSVNTAGTVATEGTTITEKADGTVEITKDEETTTITPAEGEKVTVNNDGTMELPEGTVVKNADNTTTTIPAGGEMAADGEIASEGNIITENKDGSVTVTDKDDNETTITPPTGEDVTVNADGTVEVPKGTVVKNPDNTTTTIPAGGEMAADGAITSEGNIITENKDGSVTVAAGENVTTITPDEGKDITVKPDGTMELPKGTVVKNADGTTTTLPDGGSVNTEGTVETEGTKITEDATTGTVEITKGGETTTITPPADGGSITVKPDGTVEVPAGSTVTKDGETTTLTQGGTVDKDGAVTETPVTPPVEDEDDKPTPKPPYSGGYYPSYTPSVTPAAPSVDSSSLNNAALAVGSAIKDGSAEFTPVNGYTKDEVLQLQKDGKLRMGIEKTVGYGSVADKNLAEAAIKSAGGAVSGTSVMYFDITPVLKLDNGTVVAHVTDTEKAITITIELSDELTKAAKDGKQIAVVRIHDGKAEFLSCKLNSAKTKVTFSSADFSTYAVVALNKATSAKTFDAGVAMYVGMAVLAATGSAVVIGKKRK